MISFPEKSLSESQILAHLQTLKAQDLDWQAGKMMALVYYPGKKYADIIQKAYNLFFTENALNPTAFPSLRRLETETVSMCAHLLGGNEHTAGTLTSGGTESILMAVKTARSWAKAHKPLISLPEIIIPSSAHPAFRKAFYYFGIKPVIIPIDNETYMANVQAMEQAITPHTIMLVGSAPAYPHGVIDDIKAIAAVAQKNNLLMHVDACVGGFMLPFLKQLGKPIPDFDLSVQGVTSISADLHKYGYAAKGASVILYSTVELRKHQFFVDTAWEGGIYASPSMLGSRAGGSIAAAWTALQAIGKQGYTALMSDAWEARQTIKKGIENIKDLKIIGNPQGTIVAFGSNKLDIYAIADELSLKGWHFDRQQKPASIHLTIMPAHKATAAQFVADLQAAVQQVNKFGWQKLTTNMQVEAVKGLKKIVSDSTFARLQSLMPQGKINEGKNVQRSAAMYGMMGTLSGTGALNDLVTDFLDKLNSLK